MITMAAVGRSKLTTNTRMKEAIRARARWTTVRTDEEIIERLKADRATPSRLRRAILRFIWISMF